MTLNFSIIAFCIVVDSQIFYAILWHQTNNFMYAQSQASFLKLLICVYPIIIQFTSLVPLVLYQNRNKCGAAQVCQKLQTKMFMIIFTPIL